MKSATLLFAMLLPFTASAAPALYGKTIDLGAMNLAANPCNDFYEYACGTWNKTNPIPADKSQVGRSLDHIQDENTETLHTILESYAAGNNSEAPNSRLLGDFYASCMDEKTVEGQTPAVLQGALAEVATVKDAASLARVVANFQLRGATAFFSFGNSADLKDSTKMIAELDEGGVNLSPVGMYSDSDAHSVKIRTAYLDHLTKLFQIAGRSAEVAAANAKDAFDVETSLAQASLAPELRSDPTKLYFPTDAAGLQSQVSSFDFKTYFETLGIAAPAMNNVMEPKFFAALNQLLTQSSITRLQHYLEAQTLENVAPQTAGAFYDEETHFWNGIVSGIQQLPPRWKTCVRALNANVGEAVGRAYVDKTFGPDAKARAQEMIANIRAAFESNLKNVTWLDAPTRAAALTKFHLLAQKIGYPDQWRSFDALVISRNSYAANVKNAQAFSSGLELQKIGKKVDRSEWGMTPQTVNAYYSPSTNDINFPAAILQPPMFDPLASDANNYGGIGMVIGHEMTHGFDTSGSQFDGFGNQSNWWTPSVRALFSQKAACLENQYSKYEAIPNVFVNGKLTITENIADEGGLKMSYLAYQMARAKKGPEPEVGGLNGNQQFFVAMAQSWCLNERDETLRQQVLSDVHSPAKFRVIGTMTNLPQFAEAFGCPAGSPMAPADRCLLW